MKTNDLVIREKLKDKLIKSNKRHNSIVIDELGICRGVARVDIAVINSKIHGYEIKSDSDTLDRLPNQINLFNKVFQMMTIVTGYHHLEKVERTIPAWWGIKIAQFNEDNRVIITPYRKNHINPSPETFYLAQLLWKNETIDVLEELNLSQGYKSKPCNILWKRLSENITYSGLIPIIKAKFKQRSDWRLD